MTTTELKIQGMPTRKKAAKPSEPSPSQPSGRPGKKQLGFFVDKVLWDAFEAFIESQKPAASVTAHLELSIEEYLTSRGYWPPRNAPRSN